MLTCTKCKKEKNESEFRWKSKSQGKRQCWCKECFTEHERRVWKENPERRRSNHARNTDRRKRNAQYVYDYLKEHSCTRCGESDPVVLDFDHRDPETKAYNICDMARCGLGLISIREEIEKCDVLCANCHRRRTAEQQGWYKGIIGV